MKYLDFIINKLFALTLFIWVTFENLYLALFDTDEFINENLQEKHTGSELWEADL